MKTKIVFFMPGLHGGGAEKVAVNIIREINQDKYDLHLVLTEKKGKYLDLIPDYVIVHNLNAQKTILSIFKLRKVILDIKPDIIFSTLFRTHIAVDLALLGLKFKPQTIFRSPNSPKLLIENNQLNIVMKCLLERAYKNANSIIAQTPEMKEEIVKYHFVDKKKITVFLNPIDRKLIDSKIENIESPFNTNYINVVAAGRLTQQKGFDVLIKSFADVISENNKYRLHIIGEERDAKEELLHLIDKLNLKEYVSLLGFKSNPYQYFYYCDLYVLSSRWEGLPNTVLENLYLKKPIVSTRCIPFMNELIENGKNGILVEVENKKSLAEAILNYKTIDTTYKNEKLNKVSVESLFEKVTNAGF